ncbi:hypothetical protein ACFS07_05890 [Undibacterium arcticum]
MPAEADVVPALLARLSGFDLVLCGNRSEGQTASGLLPYLLAEGLRMPLIADVLEATLQGRLLTVRQFFCPRGCGAGWKCRRRRYWRCTRARRKRGSSPMHAPQSAASRKPQVVVILAILPRLPGNMSPPVAPRPFKATVAQSGHSRMLGAIGGDSGARGGEVVKQGNAVAKAQVLLTYLREHRLIDFLIIAYENHSNDSQDTGYSRPVGTP